MNGKFKFIQSGKPSSDIVIISEENNNIVLTLSELSWIKEDDGNLICSCGSSTLKKDHIYKCLKCNSTTLHWDLGEQYEKQQQIKRYFEILKKLVDTSFYDNNTPNYFLEQDIQNALLLLTIEQKGYLFPTFLRILLETKAASHRQLYELKNRLDQITIQYKNLENLEIEFVDKLKAHAIVESKNQKTNEDEFIAFTMRLQKLEMLMNVEGFDKSVKSIEKLLIEKQNQVDKEMGDKIDDTEIFNDRLRKIEKTLNIMIELFEHGMDFEAIILKAKTYPRDNLNIDLNKNYNLAFGNEGQTIYNINPQEVFKRFPE